MSNPNLIGFSLRTAGGVVLDKRKVKLDNEGYVDMESGARYQQILKTDLEVSSKYKCTQHIFHHVTEYEFDVCVLRSMEKYWDKAMVVW